MIGINKIVDLNKSSLILTYQANFSLKKKKKKITKLTYNASIQ